ncbi:tetratricopeptide repeat protein (plasmid) [Deinococcus taeanensis]|uniref:tetratricopeptide repeat protein n=1 Tax=Deinococcus taeanensis TaxID=2737050 RepID=UPI001CDBFB98|nr:tetratricopeptide repeat protein [Deinococcus taeanensis]UBV44082.1 tetratricopeptide repeat protein [Deinococcus taeanensis]
MAPRSSQHEAPWDESITALLDAGQWDAAVRTITQAFTHARQAARFGQLLTWFEQVPAAARAQSGAVRLHLRLLGNIPGEPDLERVARAYAAEPAAAPVAQVCLAWVHAQRDRFAEALASADAALQREAELTPFDLGLVLRARGMAGQRLGRPAWEDDDHRAAQLSDGRVRGVTLMEYGSLLLYGDGHARGMEALGEATLALRGDDLEGWVLSSKGYAHLHHVDLDDAQACFEACIALRERFRPHGQTGLAAVLRARGEWDRAEALYQQAIALAARQEHTERERQARRGLGHTARMRGQPLRAIEWLSQAAVTVPADRESGASWVNVDLAAAHVSLPRVDAARVLDLLGRTGPLSGEDADRAAIVRAELARRQGRPDEAAALNRPLNRRMLWTREEATALPDLFALLGADAPEPLARPERLSVDVRAAGFGEVHLNGRRLNLPLLPLVALVALLDAGGTLDAESLAAAVGDGQPRGRRQAAQRATRAVKQLRGALGWPDSVTHAAGRYTLDPAAAWSYDVVNLQRAGEPVPAFLRGVHAFPWVMEREQALLFGDDDLSD